VAAAGSVPAFSVLAFWQSSTTNHPIKECLKAGEKTPQALYANKAPSRKKRDDIDGADHGKKADGHKPTGTKRASWCPKLLQVRKMRPSGKKT
jgi:hypothetical protein